MIQTKEADTSGHNEGVLRTMKRTDLTSDLSKFNSMNLEDATVFAKYMEGCAMKVKSAVLFESRANGDAADYIPYSTQFGSIYCGGNVGSMITEGKTTIDFSDKVIVYNKVVGGCNNAFVTPKEGFNALYEGGLLGAPDPAPAGSPEGTIGDKLELNFAGLKIQPRRWNADHSALIWNTISSSTGLPVDPVTSGDPTTSTDEDLDRRFDGGNIYGGCYSSGIVNGNVVININSSIVDRMRLVRISSTATTSITSKSGIVVSSSPSKVWTCWVRRSTCLVAVRVWKLRYGALSLSTSTVAICSRYSEVARKVALVKVHTMKQQKRLITPTTQDTAPTST